MKYLLAIFVIGAFLLFTCAADAAECISTPPDETCDNVFLDALDEDGDRIIITIDGDFEIIIITDKVRIIIENTPTPEPFDRPKAMSLVEWPAVETFFPGTTGMPRMYEQEKLVFKFWPGGWLCAPEWAYTRPVSLLHWTYPRHRHTWRRMGVQPGYASCFSTCRTFTWPWSINWNPGWYGFYWYEAPRTRHHADVRPVYKRPPARYYGTYHAKRKTGRHDGRIHRPPRHSATKPAPLRTVSKTTKHRVRPERTAMRKTVLTASEPPVITRKTPAKHTVKRKSKRPVPADTTKERKRTYTLPARREIRTRPPVRTQVESRPRPNVRKETRKPARKPVEKSRVLRTSRKRVERTRTSGYTIERKPARKPVEKKHAARTDRRSRTSLSRTHKRRSSHKRTRRPRETRRVRTR